MSNLFLWYPKCTTCQKAKKWLDQNKIQYTERHIVEKNPTKTELKKWVKLSGLEVKRFFNTSGLKYKELNLKDKLTEMADEEKYYLLSSDGMLVKRPLLITDKTILVGFKEAEWESSLN